jgi:hypothetical protein
MPRRRPRPAFAAYETALVTNDVPTLEALFWDDPRTIRYGIGVEIILSGLPDCTAQGSGPRIHQSPRHPGARLAENWMRGPEPCAVQSGRPERMISMDIDHPEVKAEVEAAFAARIASMP